MSQIDQFLADLDAAEARERLPAEVRTRMQLLLSRADEALRAGQNEVARSALSDAAHDIGDVWPFDVQLGSRILAYAQHRSSPG